MATSGPVTTNAVPTIPTAQVALSSDSTGQTLIHLSEFGDRIDWSPTPGNEEAVGKFPDPCPVCSHPVKGAHCQPYAPTLTTLVARCSAKVQTGTDKAGNPIYGRCNGGTCIIPR